MSDKMSTSLIGGHHQARTRLAKPLTNSHSLDKWSHQDLTPVIGREFLDLQVVELLESTDSDRLVTDLAVTGERELVRLGDLAQHECSFRTRCSLLARPRLDCNADARAL